MNNTDLIKKKEISNNDSNNVRILAVKWKEVVIGYLMKEDELGYLYKYDAKGIQQAKKDGYTFLVGFKDTRKVYASKDLFPVFKSRIPSKQRRDLDQKLENLGIDNYDEFEYLARSGGRLYTDAISLEELSLEEHCHQKTNLLNNRDSEKEKSNGR